MGGKRSLDVYAGVGVSVVVEWFRNTEWDDEIETSFNARLGRARSKAQYLNIQAYTLLASHPNAAADLARRAIACADEAEVARGGLYLGTALALAGDVNGAISALEDAIDAERREPMFRTAAYLDQALLVALAKRSDMYDVVWERLAVERVLPFEDQHLSVLIAHALIGSERGEDVVEVATVALQSLGSIVGEEAPLPSYLDINVLKNRLTAAASH